MANKKKNSDDSDSTKKEPIRTFELKLTPDELVHLRDLFSVSLPPDLSATVSNFLAQQENRQLLEAKLWNKITAACKSAKLPLGDDAPDFVISPTAIPAMGVFRMDSDVELENEQNVQNVLNKLSEDSNEKDLQSGSDTVHSDEQGDESSPSPSRRRGRKKDSAR